jgi:hypothetical protein
MRPEMAVRSVAAMCRPQLRYVSGECLVFPDVSIVRFRQVELGVALGREPSLRPSERLSDVTAYRLETQCD